MGRLKFSITEQNFHNFRCTRIQQGEYSAGPEAQGTILRSCICVGFYHPERRIGAISHITGFSGEGGHCPSGALTGMQKKLDRFGIDVHACECFMVGGADSQRQVYHAVKQELARWELDARELDVLGRFHRKILLDPAAGSLLLYKKAGMLEGTVPDEQTHEYFTDPAKRVVVGATLLFRNRPLLDELRNRILSQVIERHPRLHVWCAGCSLGMEVYSVAMVILDWLDAHKKPIDLKVLGTDISKEALDTAAAGVYPCSDHVVRGYEGLAKRYTERLDAHRLRMGPELRRAVTFKERDIRTGSRRHRFEIVICDHVFQYFDPGVQIEFLEGLAPAVQPRGFLYVSTPCAAVQQSITGAYPFERIARHLYRRR